MATSRWCPSCGAEYRAGFDECADCHVALVDEKPPPPAELPGEEDEGAHHRVVELTRASAFEADVIVARLRAAGLRATNPGPEIYGSLSFAQGIPVFVAEEDLDAARAVLEEHLTPTDE